MNTSPPKDGYDFILSLGINELVLMDVNKNDISWKNPPSIRDLGTQLFRVQKMDVNGIIDFAHHTVSVADYHVGKIRKNYNSFSGIKVKCNELGNILPV